MSNTLRVSGRKAYRFYNDWEHKGRLFATTGTGKGKVTTYNVAYLTILPNLGSELHEFTNKVQTRPDDKASGSPLLQSECKKRAMACAVEGGLDSHNVSRNG